MFLHPLTDARYDRTVRHIFARVGPKEFIHRRQVPKFGRRHLSLYRWLFGILASWAGETNCGQSIFWGIRSQRRKWLSVKMPEHERISQITRDEGGNSLAGPQGQSLAADAKLVEIVGPPLRHCHALRPMCAAMIRRANRVLVFVSQCALYGIR